MSTHYYDPEKTSNIGKQVYVDYNGNQPRVPSGHKLIAILNNNGLWKAAPDVTDPKEFKHFYDAYYSGMWLSMDLYLVPESKLREIEQSGWREIQADRVWDILKS